MGGRLCVCGCVGEVCVSGSQGDDLFERGRGRCCSREGGRGKEIESGGGSGNKKTNSVDRLSQALSATTTPLVRCNNYPTVTHSPLICHASLSHARTPVHTEGDGMGE